MKTIKLSRSIIPFVLFLLFSSGTGFPFTTPDLSAFYQAKAYYEHADYDEAIKLYNSILETGVESGNLYFNLGNCYFKKGELGMAILNYEKARRLIPWDKDLESNYEYALSLTKAPATASPKNPFAKAINILFERFTIDGLTILLSVLYILFLAGILSGIFFRPFKKYSIGALIFIGLFFIVALVGIEEKIALLNKEGIIISEQVDAKFEPIDKATTHFTLYEGAKVKVLESRSDWCKVKRADGKSGWVQRKAVAVF